MRRRIKSFYLVVSLFLFLLVVVGGGLHLSPAGALVGAASGTPLFIYVWNSCIRSVSGICTRLRGHRLFPETEHANDRQVPEFRDNGIRQ